MRSICIIYTIHYAARIVTCRQRKGRKAHGALDTMVAMEQRVAARVFAEPHVLVDAGGVGRVFGARGFAGRNQHRARPGSLILRIVKKFCIIISTTLLDLPTCHCEEAEPTRQSSRRRLTHLDAGMKTSRWSDTPLQTNLGCCSGNTAKFCVKCIPSSCCAKRFCKPSATKNHHFCHPELAKEPVSRSFCKSVLVNPKFDVAC